jgi:hypothetical protein
MGQYETFLHVHVRSDFKIFQRPGYVIWLHISHTPLLFPYFNAILCDTSRNRFHNLHNSSYQYFSSYYIFEKAGVDAWEMLDKENRSITD